ncbi:MAG: ATP-binding protein, partial [Candidatus Korobacteraceae bacterium]
GLSIERADDTQVVVKVRDSGCGIPPENLQSIFEPFFTTKGEQGTGIGLWVIKGIVDKLGGKIEVQSSTTGDTGTCFSIFLPVTKGNGGRQQVSESSAAAVPAPRISQVG